MLFYRRIVKISWTDKKHDEIILTETMGKTGEAESSGRPIEKVKAGVHHKNWDNWRGRG